MMVDSPKKGGGPWGVEKARFGGGGVEVDEPG